MKPLAFFLSFLCSFCVLAKSDSPHVFFKNIKDGQTISTDFKVEFGIQGMSLRPAGEDVNDKKSGHHHLIINGGPIAEGTVIPADEQNIHFGKAQKDYQLKLKPGSYTLTMQLADGAHRSYGEKLSATVKVRVK